jgi:hypothetical protein
MLWECYLYTTRQGVSFYFGNQRARSIKTFLPVDDSVYRWERGLRSPTNAVGVVLALRGLLRRRSIPKWSRRSSISDWGY